MSGIQDYIPLGAENAVTAADLSGMLGCPPRMVTRAIQRARLQGAAICSSCGPMPGYYRTEDAGELDRFVRALAHREREIEATRSALMVTRDRMSGQGRIEGF